MKFIETYTDWVRSENITMEQRRELKAMNEQQVKDSFYCDVEFGTAGMRGIMGMGTNRINIYTIRKATLGFIKVIKANKGETKGIAIGYDNRFMSYEFAMDCAKLLSMYGIKSYVYESLRPTPMLSYAVRELGCYGGIMITASHNPKEYNGYKLYDENGCQLIPSLVQPVINEINKIEDPLSITINEDEVNNNLINIIDEIVDNSYYDEVSTIQINNITKASKSDLKIVFTPQHGTANIPVQKVMKKCGYKLILVEEQLEADPNFSNTKTPNPEEDASYELALKYARANKADIVLSCDPDADRMGVAVKSGRGYKLLSGNQTAAILIEYIFSSLIDNNIMPINPVMFNTIVTSDLGEKIAANYGVRTIKTLTGFKFIGEKIKAFEEDENNNFVFGYEESYGYLKKEIVRDKDAIQACLLLAEASAYYKTKGKTLIDVLNSLYDQYGFHNEFQHSKVSLGVNGLVEMNEMLTNLRERPFAKIADMPVVKVEDFLTGTLLVNNEIQNLDNEYKANVLKYYLEDGSWIAIRPSGTEPKCKFYYCIVGENKEETIVNSEKYKNFILEIIK